MFVESQFTVSPIGSNNRPATCHPHLCPERLRRQSWMSYTPLLERKKRNLYPDGSSSRHTLCAELGCRVTQNDRSPTSLFGVCSSSQVILPVTHFLGTIVCIRALFMKCALINRKPARSNRSTPIYIII
jgi:hypothetical protein